MIPVIVGVADVKNRSTAVDEAKEPATLMLEAVASAVHDASGSAEFAQKLRSSIDSIDVVRTWTWPYADLPALLADKLGIQTKHRSYTEHGGNQPAKLLDEAARRIAIGENKVAVVTGAEALASCENLLFPARTCDVENTDQTVAACVKEGKIPPPGWTAPSESIQNVFSPTTRELKKGAFLEHSV